MAVVVVAALVAAAVPLAGLRSTPPPTSDHPGARPVTGSATTCPGQPVRTVYQGEGLRFVHPPCWRAVHYRQMSSFSSSLVDLSNQPMHDPCRTTTTSSGKLTVCREPVTRLAPDGILVLWSTNGAPRWRLDRQPGTPLTVGGRPAREFIAGPGSFCTTIGADESIAVAVAQTVPDNYYAMTACLRGPDLAAAVSEVKAMIASTTFSAP
jgi:hypothetical protein